MLKVPELGISKVEADQLSIASMNVMRHYSNTILSEKSQDWIKFAMVAGAVYVPRVAAAKTRVKAARDAKKTGTVPPGQNTMGGFERPPEPAQPDADDIENAELMQ